MARPLIAFDGARALYLGPALGLKPHRNAAFTLAIGLEAPVTLTLLSHEPGADHPMTAPIVRVPAGVVHHIAASGLMAFLYLDALGDDVAALAVADLTDAHRRIVAEPRGDLRGWSIARWRLALGVTAMRPPDPRALLTAARLGDDPDQHPSLAHAARLAGLSPSRLQAVFRAELGAPYRRYRLWRRMALAIDAVREGNNLTGAAHQAGFASSAHLSSRFRAMFGLAPSALLALKPEIRNESSLNGLVLQAAQRGGLRPIA